MAIYHCSIKIGGRSSGRSAVSAAAYRAAEKMQDHETGITHDYTKKSGVIHSEIMLPDHAPQRYEDRETLWNAVQEVEKVSNAQLFREIEVALPIEMSAAEQLEAVRDYVRNSFVAVGMCADFAIHDKEDGNPHAHIMLTTRPIQENGEWGAKEKKAYKLDENGEKIPVIDPATGEQKIGARGRRIWERELVEKTGWSRPEMAEIWRAAWAKTCNRYLDKEHQIDHRSYERQGIELEPTHHVGVVQQAMKENGKPLEFDKTEINAAIKERNSISQAIVEMMRTLRDKIKEKVRSLYERIERATRGYEDVGRSREVAYSSGAAAGRDRIVAESVQRYGSTIDQSNRRIGETERREPILVRASEAAERREPEVARLEQGIAERGAINHDRTAQLLERAKRQLGRSVDEGAGRERPSLARELRADADRALSQRADRDAERKRLAAEERRKALERERDIEIPSPRRSRGYEGPSL